MKIHNFQRNVKGTVSCPDAHCECVWRSGSIAQPVLNFSKRVGGSGQFHALAALRLRKQPLIPTE